MPIALKKRQQTINSSCDITSHDPDINVYLFILRIATKWFFFSVKSSFTSGCQQSAALLFAAPILDRCAAKQGHD